MAKANAKTSTKGAGDEPSETFDGENPNGETGGADAPPMVMVTAVMRISGPDYVVEEGHTGPIPATHAKAHIDNGEAIAVGEEMNND